MDITPVQSIERNALCIKGLLFWLPVLVEVILFRLLISCITRVHKLLNDFLIGVFGNLLLRAENFLLYSALNFAVFLLVLLSLQFYFIIEFLSRAHENALDFCIFLTLFGFFDFFNSGGLFQVKLLEFDLQICVPLLLALHKAHAQDINVLLSQSRE